MALATLFHIPYAHGGPYRGVYKQEGVLGLLSLVVSISTGVQGHTKSAGTVVDSLWSASAMGPTMSSSTDQEGSPDGREPTYATSTRSMMQTNKQPPLTEDAFIPPDIADDTVEVMAADVKADSSGQN